MEQGEAGKNSSDTFTLNQVLVDDLKKRELIQSPQVEAAFRAVLRHFFVPGTPLEEVYSDRVISAKQDDEGRWLCSSSQPAIMAIMLEQLALEPGHKVLEIGAGTGYNAALLAHIARETGQVITIDIDEDLTQAARQHLTAAGFEQVRAVCADGGYGYPGEAPFDRIILTVAAPDVLPAWWEQLKRGGRIVLPLMLRGSMKSIAFERVDDHLASLSVKDCGFIPLRGDFALALPNHIPVGTDLGLFIDITDNMQLDTEAVLDFLNEAHKDLPADVEVTFWDILGGGLWTWLALHEPGMCKIVAEGEMVERDIAPGLLVIEGKEKSAGTAVLIDPAGLAALVRPSDQPTPRVAADKMFAPDSPIPLPFPLFVRQFGSGESTAHRLLAQIQAWKASSSKEMDIRAYRKEADYQPSEGEILLEKQWTKLVIEWQASA